MAVYVALRDWFAAGADERLAQYARKVQLLQDRLAQRPGLELTPMCFTMEETLAPEPVNCLQVRVGPRAARPPPTWTVSSRQATPPCSRIVDDALVVVVDSVSDEDDELLAERLAAAFS